MISSGGGSVSGLQAIFRTVQQIDQTQRASHVQSVRNLQVTNEKTAEALGVVIDNAIQTDQVAISAKAHMIDLMA